MNLLRPAIVAFVALSLITGLAYPLLVTAIAQILFAHQANGSLIDREGKAVTASPDGAPSAAVASELIGQEFAQGSAAPSFFWGRRSATSPVPYTALNLETLTGSSGSNMGPSNPALVEAVRARLDALDSADAAAGYQRPAGQRPPIDLLTASASGLDPHISLAAAEYQVPRVAKARRMGDEEVRAIVRRHTTGRAFGVLGEPVVNVVTLNLELERLTP